MNIQLHEYYFTCIAHCSAQVVRALDGFRIGTSLEGY